MMATLGIVREGLSWLWWLWCEGGGLIVRRMRGGQRGYKYCSGVKRPPTVNRDEGVINDRIETVCPTVSQSSPTAASHSAIPAIDDYSPLCWCGIGHCIITHILSQSARFILGT